MAIPAGAHEEVLAVVSLASREGLSVDRELRDTLDAVSRELGRFLSRGHNPVGGPALTTRETQILQLASSGASAKEVAAKLFLSVSTVKTHLAHAYAKLGVHDRAGAVAAALRQALID